MKKSTKYLLIGSTEPYSGKSATVLGLTHQLKQKGISVAYGKPLGTYLSNDETGDIEEDVRFIAQSLNLPETRVRSPLLSLDQKAITQRMQGKDTTDYAASLQQYVDDIEADIFLLEGCGNLWEGRLFGLSATQIAETANAGVLLVARYKALSLADNLLAAKDLIGDRLIGVIINDILHEDLETAQTQIRPFLEEQGISVLAMLPRDSLLRSVSVRELAHQLNATVLCRRDRLDLMVQSLTIGAMNVNSALEYFRRGRNMAVVTGGDRSDLQLAALETSTQCLVLTGHVPPQDFILQRAEELEVPILSVDLDTLTTVEIIDRTFGQVRLQEPIQVQCIQELMQEHFDLDRLLEQLKIVSD